MVVKGAHRHENQGLEKVVWNESKTGLKIAIWESNRGDC